MLQNQRQTNNLYRIDSNQNLYRIILEVFTKQKSNICLLDNFSCEVIDFVARMNLPCHIFLRKVLDFVESNILVWRAEVDLVMILFVPDLGALYWIEGSNNPPLIARGIIYIYICLFATMALGSWTMASILTIVYLLYYAFIYWHEDQFNHHQQKVVSVQYCQYGLGLFGYSRNFRSL